MKARLQRQQPSAGRHETYCRVCAHPKREEIEQAWIGWASTGRLARAYGVTRDSLYRHAHAKGLFDRRARNIRAALERIIEHAEDVEVNASAVVQAVAAYARINTNGRLIERTERIDMDALFDRMSRQELEAYASEGILPDWFQPLVGATPPSSEGINEAEETP